MGYESELDYLPEEFREGGRTSNRTAESAESTRDQLRRVDASPGGFGGAGAYVSALNDNGRRQARGAGKAAEDRDGMAGADKLAADTGEEIDDGAHAQMTSAQGAETTAPSPTSRAVTDGM